ncbi:MAG: hypothetical protein J1E95_02330 [Muribaculaceae bacterium]|nr:hypothetical protein [Muribaculaceae bacterium]
MKKLFLGFLILGFLVNCTGKNSSVVINEDSVNQKNLISTTDTTQKITEELSHDINHSPIKQDTLLQTQEETPLSEEKEDFVNKIPDPLKLLKNKDKYLKSLGYKGTLKKSKNASPGYTESQKGTFVFSSGSKTCEISLFREYEKWENEIACDRYEYKVTISGDDDALENFYKKAKKLRSSGDDGFSSNVNKKGNTVILSGGGC